MSSFDGFNSFLTGLTPQFGNPNGINVGRINASSLKKANIAYCLDQLYTDYSGPAALIVRPSDEEELDIGFVNQVFDVEAFNTFVGPENRVPYSEEFEEWTATNLTVTDDEVQGPTIGSGVDAAELLDSDDASPVEHSVSINVNTGTDQNKLMRFSFAAKAGTLDFILFTFSQDGDEDVRQVFDLDEGELGAELEQGGANLVSASIESLPGGYTGGWYLCSVVFRTSKPADYLIKLYPSPTDTTDLIYEGDGTGTVYVSAAQLVRGSLAKPYSKTTTNPTGIGQIRRLYDQSGRGRHTSEVTTLTEQPRVYIGNGEWNGKAVIDMGLGRSFNTIRAASITSITDRPVATLLSVLRSVVGKTTALTRHRPISSGSPPIRFYVERNATQYRMVATRLNTESPQEVLGQTGLPFGIEEITAEMDFENQIGTISRNGQIIGQETGMLSSGNTQRVNSNYGIGRDLDNNATNTGEIAVHLLFNTRLTSTEKTFLALLYRDLYGI